MLWLGLRPSSKQEGGDEVAGGWSRKEELMCRWVGGWMGKEDAGWAEGSASREVDGRVDQQSENSFGGWEMISKRELRE